MIRPADPNLDNDIPLPEIYEYIVARLEVAAPRSPYYHFIMAYLAANRITIRTMIEQLLLVGGPVEEVFIAAFQSHDMPADDQARIIEAIRWKRRQLESRAAVFDNCN